MALIGYARVSTEEQELGGQIARLEAEGARKVFSEHRSTRLPYTKRDELMAAFDYLREGDSLMVCKLDRLARSVSELIELVGKLKEMQCNFVVLDQSIDTRTASGQLMFHMFAAFAEFERELAHERLMESIEHRRNVGGDLGGRRKSYTPEQADLVRSLRADGDSFRSIGKKVNLSLGTVQRILAAA